jgi:hypothetical protein
MELKVKTIRTDHGLEYRVDDENDKAVGWVWHNSTGWHWTDNTEGFRTRKDAIDALADSIEPNILHGLAKG